MHVFLVGILKSVSTKSCTRAWAVTCTSAARFAVNDFFSGNVNSKKNAQYTTRNTCMQQPLVLIGIQGTIFSEHEVFRVYDFSFLHFQYFSKNVKIMKVLSVLITKYIICTIFLVSNTINILI